MIVNKSLKFNTENQDDKMILDYVQENDINFTKLIRKLIINYLEGAEKENTLEVNKKIKELQQKEKLLDKREKEINNQSIIILNEIKKLEKIVKKF